MPSMVNVRTFQRKGKHDSRKLKPVTAVVTGGVRVRYTSEPWTLVQGWHYPKKTPTDLRQWLADVFGKWYNSTFKTGHYSLWLSFPATMTYTLNTRNENSPHN